MNRNTSLKYALLSLLIINVVIRSVYAYSYINADPTIVPTIQEPTVAPTIEQYQQQQRQYTVPDKISVQTTPPLFSTVFVSVSLLT